MIALRIFIRQFNNGFFYILILAALISFILGERMDSIIISGVLLINAGLGFFQEWRSQKLLKQLESFIGNQVKVKRGGKIVIVPQKELKIGDEVILESGDQIPADLTIKHISKLIIDESALSGESLPVIKKLGESLRMGSSVIDGEAETEVIALAETTEFGKIRRQAMQISSPSQFEKDVNQFSKALIVVVSVSLGLLLAAHLLFGRTQLPVSSLFLFMVALAIGIVPEAMPLVTTLSMTSGALRLARHKVVVKKLSAVEDFGNLVILCTDKTGTITEGKMDVAEIMADDKTLFNLLGLASIGKVGLTNQGKPDAFNRAFWENLDLPVREYSKQIKVLWEDPFDPETRRGSVTAEINGQEWLITKGAYESIFEITKAASRQRVWAINQGRMGRRVLAVAAKKTTSDSMKLAGLISFSDPIKKTALPALQSTRHLGLDIRLITGDSPEVAAAVGVELNFIGSADEVVTGPQLSRMTGEEKETIIKKTKVFARIFPSQKKEIVDCLETIGPVGFVGDGVNDAPALKAATVGIAADHATDVARETADIILLNKDLHIIVDGIRRGRETFANIEKYLVFTLIGDFGIFYSIAVISLFTSFLPMLPAQILLSNLLSDLPMVTIAADRVDRDKTRLPTVSKLKKVLIFSVILGLVSSVFDFGFFAMFRNSDVSLLQTLWFIFSVITELVLIFSVRTQKWIWRGEKPAAGLVIGAVAAGALTIVIPFSGLAPFFHFVRPNMINLAVIFSLTGVYLVFTEAAKKIFSAFSPIAVNSGQG